MFELFTCFAYICTSFVVQLLVLYRPLQTVLGGTVYFNNCIIIGFSVYEASIRIASRPSVSLSVLCLILIREKKSLKITQNDVAQITFNTRTSFEVKMQLKGQGHKNT